MDRSYRLSYCLTCKNKGMGPSSGIVCKMTNKPADFEDKCDEYFEHDIQFNMLYEEHRNSINIVRDLKQNGKTTLSSSWTRPIFYTTTILFLLIVTLFLLIGINNGFSAALTIILAAIAFIGALTSLLFARLAVTHIIDEAISVKRLFGSEKEFKFNSFSKVSSSRMGRANLIKCEFKLENGAKASYTIMNSKSMMAFDRTNVELILTVLKDYNSFRRFVKKR